MHVLHPLGQGRAALLLEAPPGHKAAGHWAVAPCWAAVAACAALPFVNPDLFWHLNAARRMVATGAIPRADWLSYTRAGAAWVDFEWLTQLVWYAAYSIAGFWALWVLKLAAFGAAAALVWKALERAALSAEAKGGWLLAWALALLPADDLRPEAFSLVGFSALWLWLERDAEAERADARPLELGLAFGGFALWANLHAGFAYGLILLALAFLAAQGSRRPRLARLGAAAALGTLLNPWGWKLYPVLVEHARAIGDLARVIREWNAPTMKDPWLWPFWGLFLSTFVAILLRQSERKLPRLHALAVCLFGLSAGRHVRTIPYFAIVAVPVGAAAFAGLEWRRKALFGRLALIACLAYAAFKVVPEVRGLPYLPRHAPGAVADFLEAEAPVMLEGRRLAHPWEWGGYLGWRFGEKARIYADGRYLFHDLEADAARAQDDPESYAKFLKGLGADVLLLKRTDETTYTEAPLKDGRKLVLFRPVWLFMAPRTDWALVYFDKRSLAFIRRAVAPPAWLAAHEYKLYRPGDLEAAKWLIREGQADAAVLAAELRRHGDGPAR